MRHRLSDSQESGKKKLRLEFPNSQSFSEIDAFSDVSLSLWSLTSSTIPAFDSEDELPNDFDSAFSQIVNVDPSDSSWIKDSSKPCESSLIPISPDKSSVGINKPLLDRQDAGNLSIFLEKFLEKDELWDSKTLDKLIHNEPMSDIFTHETYKQEHQADDSRSSSPSSFISVDFKRPRESRRNLLSLEQKRVNHLTSEKRRRAKCKEYVEELCYLTPRLLHTATNKKDSNRGKPLAGSSKKKSDMLAAVYSYIQSIRTENMAIRERLEKNGIEIDIPVAE